MIPSKWNRTKPREHDREACRLRHRVDSFFAGSREFRAMATRYDRTAASFASGIDLVSGVVVAR